jgi:hypothetical protein
MSPCNFNGRESVGTSIAAALLGSGGVDLPAAQSGLATSVAPAAHIKVQKGFKHFNFDASYTSHVPGVACTATIADSNKDAVIFYTYGAAAATANSTPYRGHFAVRAPATVDAIAFAPNLTPSANSVLTITAAGAVVGQNRPPDMPKNAKLAFKSYRIIWHPTVGDQAVEWDLSTLATETPSGTASQILNEEDVTDVIFSGVDVFSDKTTMNFSFNGLPLANPSFKYDGTKMTLTFYVTSDMTKKPGHKVILLNALKQNEDGTKQSTQVLLPFDVTKR